MMKRLIGILLMMVHLTTQAQPSELAALINVPALIPENDPPVDGDFPGDLLTFDRLVIMTAQDATGKEIPIYLYINTTNGDIATITGKAGNAEDGSFDIDHTEFRLTYFNAHGRVYNFYTRKKNGNIVRYMSSLNTEIHFFSDGIPFERTTVYRTGDGINPLPQGFPAHTFKASGNNAPTLVLCGGKPGAKPNKLLLKRFVGYSGIGYVKTDEGIFMVVKIKSDHGGFTATKWKNERHKIRVSDFQHVESEMYDEMAINNAKQTARLEAKTFTGNCADIERQINQSKIEQKRKEKKNIEDMSKGNPMTDASVRNAMAGLYGNPEEHLRIASLETDLRLCKLENKRIKTEDDEEKRMCLREEKNRIEVAVLELKALRDRYSNPKDAAILMIEQRKILSKYSTQTKCR